MMMSDWAEIYGDDYMEFLEDAAKAAEEDKEEEESSSFLSQR